MNVSKCWLGDFALVLALVLEDVGVLRNSNENTPRRLTRDRNLLREGPRIIIVGSSLVVVVIGIGINIKSRDVSRQQPRYSLASLVRRLARRATVTGALASLPPSSSYLPFPLPALPLSKQTGKSASDALGRSAEPTSLFFADFYGQRETGDVTDRDRHQRHFTTHTTVHPPM